MSEKTCNCDPCLEWLAPHGVEVAMAERERIIKLLEEAEPNDGWSDRQRGQSIVQWSKENFIALIKGENK